MSFKDLTGKAEAVMKPKPAEIAKTPANGAEPKAAGKEAPAKSKTS